MKLKKHFFPLVLIAAAILLASCSKKNNVTPAKTSGTVGFWHGSIGKSPNQVAQAFILRSNGTVTEYNTDFYTTGTTMTAADTANAAFKINGIYSTSSSGDGAKLNITITYYDYDLENNPASALENTYTNVGVMDGNTITGTWTDHNDGANINTVDNFTLTK